MAKRFLLFPTEAAARAHVALLDRSVAYTARGDLPLPRCDCGGLCPGDHSGAQIKRGAKVRAVCVCTSRETPDPDCPYVTWTSADVSQLDGEYLVPVDDAHARAGIDTTGARTVADDEEPAPLPGPRSEKEAVDGRP